MRRYRDWNVSVYSTPFALVTGVYDEWKGNVDLLLIHIFSAEDERIDMVRNLQDYFPHIRVIFYSENTSCAEKIFDSIPLYFLRIPFAEEPVGRALKRAELFCREDENQVISIRSKGQIQRIRFSLIRYVESVGRKLRFFTDDGSYENYMNIEDALKELPDRFILCHRSYIVNCDRIRTIDAGSIRLSSGEEIPLSRARIKEIREKLKMD